MRQTVLKVVLLAAVLGGGLGVTRWPRINEVETGAHPGVPGPARSATTDAARTRSRRRRAATVGAPAGLDVRGAGQGPGGTEIQAVASTPGSAIQGRRDRPRSAARAAGRGSRVRSEIGPRTAWTSARTPGTSRRFLAELDRELFGVGSGNRCRLACTLVTVPCLFCEIVAGRIPAKVAYQDDDVLAFHDINPQAPIHVLVDPQAAHHEPRST